MIFCFIGSTTGPLEPQSFKSISSWTPREKGLQWRNGGVQFEIFPAWRGSFEEMKLKTYGAGLDSSADMMNVFGGWFELSRSFIWKRGNEKKVGRERFPLIKSDQEVDYFIEARELLIPPHNPARLITPSALRPNKFNGSCKSI